MASGYSRTSSCSADGFSCFLHSRCTPFVSNQDAVRLPSRGLVGGAGRCERARRCTDSADVRSSFRMHIDARGRSHDAAAPHCDDTGSIAPETTVTSQVAGVKRFLSKCKYADIEPKAWPNSKYGIAIAFSMCLHHNWIVRRV